MARWRDEDAYSDYSDDYESEYADEGAGAEDLEPTAGPWAPPNAAVAADQYQACTRVRVRV